AAGLSPQFWSYAIKYSNFVNNRIVSTVHGEIPYQRFFGRLPSLDKCRVFGCLTFIRRYHDYPPKQHKPKYSRGLYLGVTEEQDKFIAYSEELKEVVVHRDMHFNEQVLPRQGTNPEQWD